MAQAPRPNKKATQVAYSLIGVPDSMRYRKTKRQKRRDSHLISFESQQYYR
jgi:uncharacterized short protein YbdD (DUF466 family)